MAYVVWVISLILLKLTFATRVDPDCKRDAIELITSKGYPAEKHRVLTLDGYILTVHRIPHGKGQSPGQRPAVLLQHGLEGSSTNWIDNYSPEQNLGFMLADAGYDVWLGNVRGNEYSLGHVKYSSKDSAFWQFSWDEMAKNDLPAMINYVVMVSKNSQIFYVGHSQGTLIGFAQFSQDSETAKKVKMFFALAPVARVGHLTGSGLQTIAQHVNQIDFLFESIGFNAFLPSSGLVEQMVQFACSNTGVYRWLCNNFVFLFFGSDATNMNQTRLPVYVCHNPSGTSSMNIAHFGQMIKYDKMQMYDYGFWQNLFKYHWTSPPMYHPEKLKVPTILFSGGKDTSADPTDVQWLIEQLIPSGNLVAKYNITNFHHLDFIFALDAPDKVYSKIIDHIRVYEELKN